MKPEKHSLTLGFIPLTDCAPLVVAQELGYFAAEGLNVALSREASWATLRDKVTVGVLDAAHMLAPMPIAASLGIGGFARPMVTALSLGLNGNGITVSRALYTRMLAADPDAMQERPISARALKKVVKSDQREGREPMTFAVVFPYSTHNYELRYWLAAAGIDPDRDVRLVVVPPPQMVTSLRSGSIDGFCVGEPWNLLAVADGLGHTLLSGYEIWNNKPEKVLAVSAHWAGQHPRTHQAILRALIRAARWLDDPVNRDHGAAMLAAPGYLGVDAKLIAASLPSPEVVAQSPVNGRLPVNPSRFFASTATFPWRSHAVWFIAQMYRWGQLTTASNVAVAAQSVYRSDIYREVAGQLGLDFPTIDEKTEGMHAEPWTLTAATRPIEMGADRFMDGRVFDPRDVVQYLRGFDIHALKPPIEDLLALNPRENAGGMSARA